MRTCVGSRGGRHDLLLTHDALRCDGGLLRRCDHGRINRCGRLGISLSHCAHTFSIVSIVCRSLQAILGIGDACATIDSHVNSCGELLRSFGSEVIGQKHVSPNSTIVLTVGRGTVQSVTSSKGRLCGSIDSLILCTAKTTRYSASSLLVILRTIGASLSSVRQRLGQTCVRA